MRGLRTRERSRPNEVRTSTVDGVSLAGVHLPGAGDRLSGIAFVVAHGMTNATAKPSTQAVLGRFARQGAVVAFDFRGHGRSAGRSTVGRDEVHDVDAAIGFARTLGYRKIALVGFSLGAAVSLRHAGSLAADPALRHAADVVVAVSPPARWFLRESRSMLRVQWLMEHPLGPWVAPRLGIRLDEPWPTVPSTPLEVVRRIAPTPLLLVHGTADHYFGPEQSVRLHRAAPGSELWLIDGMGHAESGTSGETLDRIAAWAVRPRMSP
ncbi:MAG: alpha/beta fold hydrolase [Nakamurella sp.]